MTDKPMSDKRLKELEPLFRKWGFCYKEIREAGAECLEEIRRLKKEKESIEGTIEMMEGTMSRLHELSNKQAIQLKHQAAVVKAAKKIRRGLNSIFESPEHPRLIRVFNDTIAELMSFSGSVRDFDEALACLEKFGGATGS